MNCSTLTFLETLRNVSMVVTPEEMENYALLMLSVTKESLTERDRWFRGIFGTSPQIVSILWNMLDPNITMDYLQDISPKHLLWTCMFMKSYCTETYLACFLGVTEKTLRKWVWIFIEAISFLEPDVVSVKDDKCTCKRDINCHFTIKFKF